MGPRARSDGWGMRTIAQLLEFIEELEMREKANLDECRRIGCMNTPGSGMAIGSLETLREIREFLSDPEFPDN